MDTTADADDASLSSSSAAADVASLSSTTDDDDDDDTSIASLDSDHGLADDAPGEEAEHPHKTRPLTCDTHKGTGGEHRRMRTAGAVYFLSPCGVCFGMWELYGTESLSQVFLALVYLLTWAVMFGFPFPMAACYDDACHMLLFCLKRQHLSARALFLSLIDWSIDRFHYGNHKYVYILYMYNTFINS